MREVASLAFSYMPADFSCLKRVELAVKERVNQFSCSLTIHARLRRENYRKTSMHAGMILVSLFRAFVIIASYYKYQAQPVFIPARVKKGRSLIRFALRYG